jgi:predicted metal-binding protein
MDFPSLWLKVCVTCDRFAGAVAGETGDGEKLAARIEAALEKHEGSDAFALRRVPCLSGCKHPGNVAVGATGRAKFRFHNLGQESAETVAAFAYDRWRANDEIVGPDDVPRELRSHLAATILPR